MRILTFNHHESFIASLAQTGHEWFVVTNYKGLDLRWSESGAPLPNNIHLRDWSEVEPQLKAGYFDKVVCHTVKNLFWLWRFRFVRIVFIAHIPLFTHTLVLRCKSLFKKLAWRWAKRWFKASFVAVSEFKRKSWNEAGEVIVLTPRILSPIDYSFAKARATVVCNQLANRADELGLELIMKLVEKDLPIVVIGNNPGIAFSVKPSSREDFEKLFRGNYVYLYTIRQPYGDGYNTAMLEAMAMGMAIVTVANPSSPIQHNVNGLVANSAEELATNLETLFDDRELARRLGREAMATIERDFSQEKFVESWNNVLMS